MKGHEKTVRAVVKQDSNPDLTPLDYAIWGVLEKKTDATSHRENGSFKTAMEEERNKMTKSILKVCKFFRRLIDTIKDKNSSQSFFRCGSIFLFCFLVFKWKLILFYNCRIFYTRVFLILYLHPVLFCVNLFVVILKLKLIFYQ